jgi:hypothetical protein
MASAISPATNSAKADSMRTTALFFFSLLFAFPASPPQTSAQQAYLGFDRNDYPGDAALPILRKSFSFTGYWLSPPPGEKNNTWLGKRKLLRSQGFGFLLLYRGRESREVESSGAAIDAGYRDAKDAAAAAKSEGFASDTIIFLDIEEGGRLPSNYLLYIAVWFYDLTRAGFRPGVYCSGMPVGDGPGVTITTAENIRSRVKLHDITFWVYNDACLPSPGCVVAQNPPHPSRSGIPHAQIWQFVRSPRDKETAVHCTGYAKNGHCYAPGDTSHSWFLDVNTATSPDPSGGAK